MQYFIGIDGGGTSCRAALCDHRGAVLGRGHSGAANILTDPDGALAHICEATELAFRDAGLPADPGRATAVLGLAGSNIATAVQPVHSRLPFARATIVSDALIALEGAVGRGDGAIGIIGTGTAFLARKAGRLHPIAGWGFHLGDLGSGARLGQHALQESLLAFDGLRSMTGLSQRLLARFDDDPQRMVSFANDARPADYGSFAPAVFEAAAQGDTTALHIVHQAAAMLDQALDAVETVTDRTGPLCLLGGWRRFIRHIWPSATACASPPAGDALSGAVALAIR